MSLNTLLGLLYPKEKPAYSEDLHRKVVDALKRGFYAPYTEQKNSAVHKGSSCGGKSRWPSLLGLPYQTHQRMV